jgi:hypothetical protein
MRVKARLKIVPNKMANPSCGLLAPAIKVLSPAKNQVAGPIRIPRKGYISNALKEGSKLFYEPLNGSLK